MLAPIAAASVSTDSAMPGNSSTPGSLHADAEAVLELVEGGEASFLEGGVPQFGQHPQRLRVRAAKPLRRRGHCLRSLPFAHASPPCRRLHSYRRHGPQDMAEWPCREGLSALPTLPDGGTQRRRTARTTSRCSRIACSGV